MGGIRHQNGGIARWSLHHPVGVVMITLAVATLGLMALERLQIDLLPHIIYPSIGVRVNQPGTPARIMEDEVTRQLEEQLAITEGAVFVRSTTRRGRSAVDLDFAYGTDMDAALRDASTRLDRAKRFLPEGVEPPVIYKRDPSQLPVAEYAIASTELDPVALRRWVDYTLGKWLITQPGVAAAEVAGGLRREIAVLARQNTLAAHRLGAGDLAEVVEKANHDRTGGRLRLPASEFPLRLSGRLRTLDALEKLPVPLEDSQGRALTLPLAELARVADGHEEPRVRIRLDGRPAVRLSIQKQPQANTVAVEETVNRQLDALRDAGLVPKAVEITQVGSEARHIRAALRNAFQAALLGALLAMVVVWLFLGTLGRTLVIGTAIPVATLATLALMAAGGLTLNLMTLGGLALGIGLLVDGTIVMLENIDRHQRQGLAPLPAAEAAAGEVTSPILAATATNLAAVVPFLFTGGLAGLLFDDLILTLSAAILAAMAVALTLVPALAGRRPPPAPGRLRRSIDRLVNLLESGLEKLLGGALAHPWLVLMLALVALGLALPPLLQPLDRFLPKIDDGRVGIYLTADPQTGVDEMDRLTRRIEVLVEAQPGVASIFTTVGGFTFGRSVYQNPNRANIQVQLHPAGERPPVGRWIAGLRKAVKKAAIPGLKVRIRQRGIRGLRLGRGSDDLSFKLQGPDLAELERLSQAAVERLQGLQGIRNLRRSNEARTLEMDLQVDRDKAQRLGLDLPTIARTLRLATEGEVVGRYLEDDLSTPIRLRLVTHGDRAPDLEQILILGGPDGATPVPLAQVARVRLVPAPATIEREQQQRVVEISATLADGASLPQVAANARARLAGLQLPPGYSLREGGALEQLRQERSRGLTLLALALLLVLVAMAVQYESLRDPLVILLGVPFSLVGVTLGLEWTDTSLTMPVWLGLILLAGILVNNAILLVETIGRGRAQGLDLPAAVRQAARRRLRPILMTTLTTVAGMLPLALGWGEGAELLQPLAITLVAGLSFSLLVSLVVVPVIYRLVWGTVPRAKP